jgi:hypothetical protein
VVNLADDNTNEVKTMYKGKASNQATPTRLSRGNECFHELKCWVAQTIADAERSGDKGRKRKFLALQAELV